MQEEILTKVCVCCVVAKPLDSFRKCATGRDGKRTDCKDCEPAASRAYTERHKEWWRKWAEKNKEARKLYRVAYNERNKAALREKRQAHYQANKARQAEKYRQWAQRNPEKRRAINERHAPRRRQYDRQRQALHPEIHAAKESKRRALKKSLQIGDGQAIKDFYAFVRNTTKLSCYWCRKIVPKDRRHVDHIIPLARGGSHALSNLCCACATCNQKKNAKLPFEFAGQGELPLY